MKTILSVLSVGQLVFVLLIMLPHSTELRADGDQGICDLLVSIQDNTCSNTSLCNSPFTDGQGIFFVAPCTQAYKLRAKLDCSNTDNCGRCLAYVRVTDTEGHLVCSTHTECVLYDCSYEESCNLVINQSYTITVFMRHCDGTNCQACENCTAYGQIYN